MIIEDYKNVPVDPVAVKNAVDNGEAIEIHSFSLSRELEQYTTELLTVFLHECVLEFLFSSLSYSAGELLANASKANFKRVYFQEKGLDITKAEDYKTGMLTFSTELSVNKEHFQQLQEKENYYINFILQYANDALTMKVVNRAELTEVETERINEKIERAKKYNSMEEALMDIDRTEGSGLGIIIIILMLKKMGLTKDNFVVNSGNGETHVKVVIPTNSINIPDELEFV